MVLEAELTLDQEGPELFEVHAVEGVRFPDFGMGGGRLVGPVGRVGEEVNGDG